MTLERNKKFKKKYIFKKKKNDNDMTMNDTRTDYDTYKGVHILFFY